MSQGILAKKSLYENNNQIGEKSDVKKSTTSKTTKENGLTKKTKDPETKKPDVKNTVESRNRKESQSYGKPCNCITPPNYRYIYIYFILLLYEKKNGYFFSRRPCWWSRKNKAFLSSGN